MPSVGLSTWCEVFVFVASRSLLLFGVEDFVSYVYSS